MSVKKSYRIVCGLSSHVYIGHPKVTLQLTIQTHDATGILGHTYQVQRRL